MRLFSGERQRNTGGTHLERRENCDGTARVYNGCQQAGNAPGDYVREQIRIARTLTDRPIGVNVMLMSPYAGQVAEAAAEEKVAVVTTGGGHVGELTTMVLVPQVCDAAGGIADGRGAAAAFMLGACGVQMDTRFLSAAECSIHPDCREWTAVPSLSAYSWGEVTLSGLMDLHPGLEENT